MRVRAPPTPWPSVAQASAPVPALFSVVSLQNVDLVLSIVLSLAAVAVVGALAVAFRRELRNDTIIISPIAVPRDLGERGYQPQVVAARLLDAYRDLHAESGTQFHQRVAQRAEGVPDVQLPGGRTSMRGIVRYLRHLFGRPAAEIEGEVTREGDGYTMRLRYGGVRIEPVERDRVPNADIASVLRSGAADLMLVTDPGTLGQRLMQQERPSGRYPLAERVFERAVHSNVTLDRVRGYLGLARIREAQERFAEAEVLFKKAIAEPAATAMAIHGYLLLLLKLGRIDDAVAEATRYAREARTDAQRTAAAVGLIDVRKNAEALELIDRLVAKHPRDGQLHLLRGRALAGLHRWRAAVTAIERATTLEPSVFNWRQYLAWALAQANRPEEGIAIARPIAQLHNGDEWGQFCLGIAELEAGHLDVALDALATAHRASPSRASYACQYARALVMDGRPADALNVMSPIVRHPAMSPRRGWAEGLALQALGRNEDALAVFEESANADANDPLPRSAAADLLARLGRTTEAQAKASEAQALTERNFAFA